MQVRVEVETCENLRTLNPSGLPSKMGSGGSYGFVEKVVDGITVTVNSVLVILHSHVFTASFQVRYSFESYLALTVSKLLFQYRSLILKICSPLPLDVAHRPGIEEPHVVQDRPADDADQGHGQGTGTYDVCLTESSPQKSHKFL